LTAADGRVDGAGTRAAALKILIDYEKRDAYLGALLSAGLTRSELDRRDKALVTELVQGTVRMKLSLDWALKGFSRRPLDELDPGVLWSLRLGAYQVMFTSIPDYAAVDMSANATAEVVGRHAVGYVNAVMRAFTSGRDKVEWPDLDGDPVTFIEVKYSHPRWIVEMWVRELGLEKTESLCAADNVNPGVALRTNLLRTTRDGLAASLVEKGLEVTTGEMTPECLLAKHSGPVGDLDEFVKGLFAVQDQGSQLVSHKVNPEAGMRVLDMCAAPGGKANHLAELMGNEGLVMALDLNATRLGMVTESAGRLGNSIVRTVELDGRLARSSVEGEFDRVLVDAPCTGLGTLARRPDARWRREPGDVERLSILQGELLAAGSEMVAPGGLLVYSTCTVSHAENAGVVTGFIERHAPEFQQVPLALEGREPAPWLQLLADTDRCDGMFMAAMKRVS